MSRIPARRIVGLACVAWSLAGPIARGDDPPPHRVEALEMIAGIFDGSGMTGKGWFHPGEMKYGWAWLAGRFDEDGDGAVIADEFPGSAKDFARLDRDRDGKIEAEDFDWSDSSPYLRQGQYFNYHFRRIDLDKNGLVSREEWDAFFARIGEGKEDLTPDDFRQALTMPPPPPPSSRPDSPTNASLPGAPSKKTLLVGMLRSEVGSVFEGPRVGRMAPDFTLPTRDGSRRVSLGKFRGKSPVVLVFGNVTCGPFRSRFGLVEDLNRRLGDRATFLNVYVREAHPIDGWRMPDNDEVGIEARQPATFAARTALAEVCGKRLKTRMTMLVDGMDDRVGHLYSGMPSRLYVIDKDGRVAYQSGRGPFGFKAGELEQALLLTLLAEADPEPR